jgi:hypothetical protein
MPEKSKDKPIKKKLAQFGKTGQSRGIIAYRTYVKKHADAMDFFYKSEISEISMMVAAADDIAKEKLA